jgi:hypothetical protein
MFKMLDIALDMVNVALKMLDVALKMYMCCIQNAQRRTLNMRVLHLKCSTLHPMYAAKRSKQTMLHPN